MNLLFSVQPAQHRRRAKTRMQFAAALTSNRSVLGSSPIMSTFLVLQSVQYFARQRHIIFVYRFSSILYIVLCAAVVLLYIKNNNSFLITYSPGNPCKFKVFDIIQRTNWLKQQDMQDLFNGQIGVSLWIKTIRNFRL